MKSQIQALRDQSPPQCNGQSMHEINLEQQKFTFKKTAHGLEASEHKSLNISSVRLSIILD